jgi:predicted GNAT superfamily acetyltransferase
MEMKAVQARIELVELDEMEQLRQLESLFATIWEGGRLPITRDMMRALSHAGSYVVGAISEGAMVGGSVGVFGREPDGEIIIHSHITGVLPDSQLRGVGYLLKQHQRQWALERGVKTITWTFDPLVRRNAYFNLSKLGADAAEYHSNFYGAMDDAINAGDESDRILMRWRLDGERAVAAAAGHSLAPELDGTLQVLRETNGGKAELRALNGVRIACQVPDDIVALRNTAPQLAADWRKALREALGDAMHRGYHVTGMTRTGWYVLEESR